MSSERPDATSNGETKPGLGTKVSPSDEQLRENSKKNLDERLDEAVEETFPDSDPVSVKVTK